MCILSILGLYQSLNIYIRIYQGTSWKKYFNLEQPKRCRYKQTKHIAAEIAPIIPSDLIDLGVIFVTYILSSIPTLLDS